MENNGANQFEIKAAVRVPSESRIRSGYSANAEIELQSVRDVITLPESAVEFENGLSYVYLVKGEGDQKSYERHQVETGLSDGINIEIKSGVTTKDRVRGPKIVENREE